MHPVTAHQLFLFKVLFIVIFFHNEVKLISFFFLGLAAIATIALIAMR